jgi:hypothetical protein
MPTYLATPIITLNTNFYVVTTIPTLLQPLQIIPIRLRSATFIHLHLEPHHQSL